MISRGHSVIRFCKILIRRQHKASGFEMIGSCNLPHFLRTSGGDAGPLPQDFLVPLYHYRVQNSGLMVRKMLALDRLLSPRYNHLHPPALILKLRSYPSLQTIKLLST